jgi:multiple sugar transport system substrate-binding protein
MQRRQLMKSAAITVFGAGLPYSGAIAQNRFAKYAGQTVTINIPAHPHYDACTKLLPEFTKATGIKVEADKLAIGRLKEKQLLEMAKPQGDYDLACYIVMWKGEYVAKNLVQPLEPFFANAALADPSYDMKDIIPIYLENLGLVGGPKGYLAGPGAKLYGLPYGAETSVLAYRRDVFAKLNLKPPENYDEFAKALRVLKNQSGIGALTSRGQAGHQAVHAWLLHLNPLGGSVFDEQWRPRFNDAQGVAALKFLQEVVATGPAGIPGYGQGEANTAFLQGQAAMYLDSTSLAGVINDPARSRVAGNVSWARAGDPEEREERRRQLPADAVADLEAAGQGGDEDRRRADAQLDDGRRRPRAPIPRVHRLQGGAEVQQPRLAADHPGLGQDQRAGARRRHLRGADRQEERRGRPQRHGAAGHGDHARSRLQDLSAADTRRGPGA